MPRHKGDGAERHDLGDEHEGEHGSEGEHPGGVGEPGIRYRLAETAQETCSGVRLELRFDAAAETFTGTVVNTTAESVSRVRVEVHLSNGVGTRSDAEDQPRAWGNEFGPAGQPKANALKPGRRMRRLVRGNTGNGIAERATRDCGPPGRGADQRSAVPRLRAAMPPAGRRPATCRARRGKARPSRRGCRSTSASRCGGRTPCLPAWLAGEAAGPLPTLRGS